MHNAYSYRLADLHRLSVRRAAWITRPHIQAVCLVTLLPLLLPLPLLPPLLSLLLFLQSAAAAAVCSSAVVLPLLLG